MVLYQCGGKAGNLLRYVPQESVACYGPEMPGSWEPCLTPVVAWAIGSRGDCFTFHPVTTLKYSIIYHVKVI